MEGIDPTVEGKLDNFRKSVDSIEKILLIVLDKDKINELTTKEKLDNDIFMAYMLNTLYWLYLRSQGIDPNTSNIKQELERVKEYMTKAKMVEDSKHRPKVNVPVAGRFIKHNVDNVNNKRKMGQGHEGKYSKRKFN